MKALIILSLSLVSLNVFAAEVGESLAGECTHTVQSAKREAKAPTVVASEDKKPETKAISK